jgi:flavin reductase (DIM6/NTAB) family NADH-FMN oxidoreductase RutF
MSQPRASAPTPKDHLGAALGPIPSGLFILTMRHGEQKTGMLLSWVQQCAFDPPKVSFCVKEGRWQLDWLKAGAAATLHLLGAEKGKALMKHFGPGFEPHQDPFAALDASIAEGKAPRLADALAWVEVKPEAFMPVGDHTLVVAQALAGQMQDPGQPWVHIRRTGFSY